MAEPRMSRLKEGQTSVSIFPGAVPDGVYAPRMADTIEEHVKRWGKANRDPEFRKLWALYEDKRLSPAERRRAGHLARMREFDILAMHPDVYKPD